MIKNIYRSIKYKNKFKQVSKHNDKHHVRRGDKVKVIRGEFKNHIGFIKKYCTNYVYIDNLFTTSIASSRYNNRNNGKRIEVNKYLKISINNVSHINSKDEIIKVKRSSIIKDNGVLSRKNIVDQEGNLIDNFMSKVKLKRVKKEEEKVRNLSNKQNNSNFSTNNNEVDNQDNNKNESNLSDNIESDDKKE